MDLFLAICQAIGLALAVGIGGVLAALFVAVMASTDAGIDLRGTDWEFIGEGWFIAILFAANVLAFYESRRPPQAGAASTASIAGFAQPQPPGSWAPCSAPHRWPSRGSRRRSASCSVPCSAPARPCSRGRSSLELRGGRGMLTARHRRSS